MNEEQIPPPGNPLKEDPSIGQKQAFPEGTINPVTQEKKDQYKTHIMMAMLAYVGPLIIVSFLTHRHNDFVKFHIKQGSILVLISALLWVIRVSVFFVPNFVSDVLQIGLFILAIIGILNALNGQKKELPLLGHYGSRLNF